MPSIKGSRALCLYSRPSFCRTLKDSCKWSKALALNLDSGNRPALSWSSSKKLTKSEYLIPDSLDPLIRVSGVHVCLPTCFCITHLHVVPELRLKRVSELRAQIRDLEQIPEFPDPCIQIKAVDHFHGKPPDPWIRGWAV